jgi:hypothetical protein
LPRAPESFVFASDFFTSGFAQPICVAEFRIKNVRQFPTVQNKRIGGIVQQVCSSEHS